MPSFVEGAQGNMPRADHVGNLVHGVMSDRRALTDEDGMARAIGPRRGLVNVVQEDQRLALARGAKFDAFRVPGVVAGDNA